MLMIYLKARREKLTPKSGNDDTPNPSDRLIEEIRKGLERIIATVTNYAIAFEALDGMRGKCSATQRIIPTMTDLVRICR